MINSHPHTRCPPHTPLNPPSPPLLSAAGARRRFALFGAVYVLLWIAAWYGADRVLESRGVASLWFVPAGLRFFSLLALGGYGVLLELATQSVFALMQITSIAGAPITDFFSTNTLWRLFNLLGSLAANALVALPLRRWLGNAWDFTEPAHTAIFLCAALAACLLSALAGTFGLLRLGVIAGSQFAGVFPTWFVGDFVAIITLTPLLLVRFWPSLEHYLQRGRWRRRISAASADRDAALIALASLLLVFGLPWSFTMRLPFPLVALLLLLPLAAVALRYGLRGALLGVALLDGGLVILTTLLDQRGEALHYQVVMIAIAFSGLWLGGLVDARRKLMARYRDFASVSNDLLWETDAQGCLCEIGGRLARRIDLSLGQPWRILLADAAPAQLLALDQAIDQRQPFRQLEIALRGIDNDPLWISLNGLPLVDETGALTGYRGTAVDVTRARQAELLLRDYNTRLLSEVAGRTGELRRSHSALLAKERHLEVVLAAVPVGVLELDGGQCCRYINANGCVLTGFSQEQAIGRPFLDFVHADERAHVDFVWRINRHSSDVHWLEFRLERTDFRCTAHWIRMPNGAENSDEGAIVVLANATARSQQDERLWTLAHHDALTDLPNRHLFWDRARQALLHAKRDESGAALLWIDLDGFKAVNDSLGHAAGDALLQQVAQRLKARMRTSDTVARIGGDEFAVIMPDIAGAEAALHAATALLTSLAEPFHLPQGEAHTSSSIGVALYPQHAQTAETLTQCADVAMYAAKNCGKNQARLWSAD